jgi:hypothetical protein
MNGRARGRRRGEFFLLQFKGNREGGSENEEDDLQDELELLQLEEELELLELLLQELDDELLELFLTHIEELHISGISKSLDF